MVEQAIETAALMFGSDKSQGYCLEMICADFLAGASLEDGNSQVLLQSMVRRFKSLSEEEQRAFLVYFAERDFEPSPTKTNPAAPRCRAVGKASQASPVEGQVAMPSVRDDVQP